VNSADYCRSDNIENGRVESREESWLAGISILSEDCYLQFSEAGLTSLQLLSQSQMADSRAVAIN